MADEENSPEDRGKAPEGPMGIDLEYGDQLGEVVVVPGPDYRLLMWFAGITITLLILMTCGWLFLLYTKTDEELLAEKLNHHPAIRQMLNQAEVAIQSSSLTVKELEEALDIALDVAQTPLRNGKAPPSPYISERYTALIVIMEGLLRLDLSMGLDPSDDGDYAFFRKALDQLGEIELEYMEQGILVRKPLLQSSQIRRDLKELERFQTEQAKLEIIALQQKIEELEQTESFTIVGPALTLGKWYRYYNEREKAERCFNLGRSYVEGLRKDGQIWPGRRPTTLSAVWTEYVGCLEGLTEISFRRGKYREARSFLTRIFNTPKNTKIVNQERLGRRKHQGFSERIERLNDDVKMIETAIKTPLSLPSFPFIEEEDVDWTGLFEQLANISSDRSLAALVMEGLPEQMVKAILSGNRSVVLREKIIGRLNLLIKDSNLNRSIDYQIDRLSLRSQEILDKNSNRSLSLNQLYFLNRDIIDTAFGGVLRSVALSDGTRLHNGLPKEQESLLISLYEEQLAFSGQDSEEKKRLQQRIKTLYAGEGYPTISELHAALKQRKIHYNENLAAMERVQKEQEANLGEIQKKVSALEKEQLTDIDTLFQLREKEKRTRTRLMAVRSEMDRLRSDMTAIGSEQGDLAWGMRHQLAETRRKILQLEEHNHAVAEQNNHVPTLQQIERQMVLKGQYLELLEELNRTVGSDRLVELNLSHKKLSASIEEIEKKLSSLKGEAREQLEKKLEEKKQQHHQILKEFNTFFSPLKEKVEEIAAEEEKLWSAEERMRVAQEEALRILGTEKIPGSLEQKIAQRTVLLLRRPEGLGNAPLYEAQIRQLTQEISEENSRLRILLEEEKEAKDCLAIVQPELFFLNTNGETTTGLGVLRAYLNDQEKLIETYNLLWQQRELQQEICDHEALILREMEMLSAVLGADDELSEPQVQATNRLMQQLLQNRNKVRSLRSTLTAVKRKGSMINPDSFDKVGKGYLLDSAELFQMEHQMGLNIRSYKKTFEERAAIIEEMCVVLEETQQIEKQRLQAIRSGDQAEIDRLLPTIMEHESIVAILTERLSSVNERLRSFGEEYFANFHKVIAFREKLEPEIGDLQRKTDDLAKEMARRDKSLKELSAQLFGFKKEIDRIVTTIKVEDLGDLSRIIEQQRRGLKQLKRLRDLRFREQYYQAKALWLTGSCLVAQSKQPIFQELVYSNKCDPLVLEEEYRHGTSLVVDFDVDYAYSENSFGGEVKERDDNQVNFEMWVNHLELSALELFEEELPKYAQIGKAENTEETIFNREQQKDCDVFIARSHFLSGEIYMMRAMRAIRSNYAKTGRSPNATNLLSAAERSFDQFLEFTHSEEELTEKMFSSSDFPKAKRHPVKLIEDAYIYLGVINTLKDQYSKAIFNYRKMLSYLMKKNHFEKKQIQNESNRKKSIVFFEPEKLEQGHYENHLAPFFVRLMAEEPLTHEILYRLGKNYQALAEAAMEKAVCLEQEAGSLPPTVAEKSYSLEIKKYREQFYHYSNSAIAYQSQLIIANSFSPYLKAALLSRAKLYTLRDNYEAARNDYVTLLGDPDDQGGSWDPIQISLKGDLPGELDPGFTFVALELGKLYLSKGDYSAAAEIYQKVQEGTVVEDETLVRAKIAYSEALIAKKDWVPALFFLSQLLEERPLRPLSLQHLYHYDLSLDLAEVEEQLGNFSKSMVTAKKILNFSPKELLRNGALDLSSKRGLHRLQKSSRDLIRPLARYAEHIAQISEKLHQFPQASRHYRIAEQLYRIVPWQDDRLLRKLSRDQYETFKDTRILATKWGEIRSTILQLQSSLFVDLQRSLGELKPADLVKPEVLRDIKESVAQGVKTAERNEDDLRQLLDKVTDFYLLHQEQLPETRKRQEVAERRQRDRELGGQGLLRFEALKRIHTEVQHDLPANILLTKLLSQFSEHSVEQKLLNDFFVEYDNVTPLPKVRGGEIHDSKFFLSNLLASPERDALLAEIHPKLLRWLEEKMIQTGLDDALITLSEQAKTLEEVALFRASLLGMMRDYESYHQLVSLANETMKAVQSIPVQWQQRDEAWQIVEIAALEAENRQDWERVITMNRFLLQLTPVFLKKERQQQHFKALSLAIALQESGKRLMEEGLFLIDDEEKELLQTKAEKLFSEAYQRLRTLSKTEGTDAEIVATRIRAKQRLEEAGL